jgi:predicted transcriptional regulator
MSNFATKGQPGGANGMAALAIVRSLLRHLEKTGALIPNDAAAILADAAAQIPSENNERSNEARRLIERLKS